MQQFKSNGKLLISAEYLVLDGAKALALPTKFGQFLEVEKTKTNTIVWESFNVKKQLWFKGEYDLKTLELISQNDLKVAETLAEILKTADRLNPNILKSSKGFKVKTNLEFPNEWGLGTSSTLINNIATWFGINAFELLELSFGGSGYDIACAQNDYSITYQRNGIHPVIKEVAFNPTFKEQLFFVYLNQKQDSKEGIKMYRSLAMDKSLGIQKINEFTNQMIQASTLLGFENVLTAHEVYLSSLLQITTVKQQYFSDYKGAVKSLGAWGGDFVLVTGEEQYVDQYFKAKGYSTILPYVDMIL